MNWLYVTTVPWPLTHGTALRVWHICRQLKLLGDDVSLLTSYEGGKFAEEYERQGVRVLPCPMKIEPRESRRWRLKPFDTDVQLASLLAEVSRKYDIVVLSGVSSFQYASKATSSPCVVADIIDDPVLTIRRQLWQDWKPAVWLHRLRMLVEMRVYEKKFVPSVSIVSFVSEEDAGSFSQRNPSAHVIVSPNGVDLGYHAEIPAEPQARMNSPSIIFVGNYPFLPNETAAFFLIKQIAPLVWRKFPDARFRLVGPNPSNRLQALAGERVEITGWVEDVRTHLAQASVVAIPMTTGTGIKNKLLEAWASSRAVVATPLACQGVPARDGENILVGRTKEELAGNICRLLRDEDLRQSIAREGRRSVEQGCSWDTVVAAFRAAVSEGFVAKRKRCP